MNKEELLKKLSEIFNRITNLKDEYYYQEHGHIDADEALIDFINDNEIKEAYNKIDKWYS